MTAGSIRISYIITTRNRGKFLERTLRNVREFITPADELIVIDGNSNDETADVIRKNVDLVTVFRSEPDFSEAHAFNKALFSSRGRFLKPITDDDYFYPDVMRKLIDTIEQHPEIDAILCGGELWHIEQGKPVFREFRGLPAELPATPDNIFSYAHVGLGLIMRRTALERTGGVSGNYASVDGDLICRLLECGCSLRYLDLNLYRWHLHPHSGYNKSPELMRDWLLFDIRLGLWDRLFRTDPSEMAPLTFRAKGSSRNMTPLFEIMKNEVLIRTPIRLLLKELVARGVRRVRSKMSWPHRPQFCASALPKAVPPAPGRQWTGLLR